MLRVSTADLDRFILHVQVFAVSSAGATFALVQDVAALRLGAWRLQMTSMLISPAFAWQFYRCLRALALNRLYCFAACLVEAAELMSALRM